MQNGSRTAESNKTQKSQTRINLRKKDAPEYINRPLFLNVLKFDNFTDIVYTFAYDGVKEDIVLEKYNGKNTFDFEVITGGLSLEEEKGALLLKDENGEADALKNGQINDDMPMYKK